MNFKKRVNGSWIDTPYYIHKTDTDTITTLPADIYANDITATVGLKGQMEQSSQPSPTTPIQPSETGDKTANLINNANIEQGGWSATMGTVPTKTESPARCRYNYFFPVSSKNVLYDFKDLNVNIVMMDSDGLSLGGSGFKTGSGNFTLLNDTVKISLIIANSNSTDNITPSDVQSKNISLDYGYKIPIKSGGTTTDVYLGEVQSKRRIKKLVFNGTENWQKATNFLYLSGLIQSNTPDCICTHYKGTASGTDKTCTMVGNVIRVYDSSYSTAEDFKTYLAQQYSAGTPVTVWYVLATPTTGIVNEPIRKIGDYADSVSGISIPTIAGANTLSVDTTLQPSEVTVNYKGWHPVADT